MTTLFCESTSLNSSSALPFAHSDARSLGIELELQLTDPETGDLMPLAPELLERVSSMDIEDRVKPEITRSMIELNSSVHSHPDTLLAEMKHLRTGVLDAADHLGIEIAGGGTHLFQRWNERKIFDSPRFEYLSKTYGYLASQFTVFGQHIHIGCVSGDEAIKLTQHLSAFVPHFIALTASSPYYEGVDTRFSCCRLNAVNGFPMAGHLPENVDDWAGFEAYFSRLSGLGLIASIKDLYWDIRPKPEFGTVEVRVCDTPLTIERAVQLGAFAQALSVHLLKSPVPGPDQWFAYRMNRFQACRYGLEGLYVDAVTGKRMQLKDHFQSLLPALLRVSDYLGTRHHLEALREGISAEGGDAQWLRHQVQTQGNLRAVVGQQAERWRGGHPRVYRPEGRVRRVRAYTEPSSLIPPPGSDLA